MDNYLKKIKIEKALDVTELDGEKVMIDFESGKYFMVKGAGNEIWDLLSDGITPKMVVEKLISEYEVTLEACKEQVMEFLNRVCTLGFISYYD